MIKIMHLGNFSFSSTYLPLQTHRTTARTPVVGWVNIFPYNTTIVPEGRIAISILCTLSTYDDQVYTYLVPTCDLERHETRNLSTCKYQQ